MKRKIFSVLFALVLVLALMPVMAVPVAAQDEMPDAIVIPFVLGVGAYEGEPESTAEWDEVTVHDGSSSVHLTTAGSAGNEARILIDFSSLPEGEVLTLGDIEAISWYEYLVAGYPPHVDIKVDTDGDGIEDDALVIEYAYNTEAHAAEGGPTYGAVTGDWYQTFSDDTLGPAEIDDTTNAWLTSGPAGPLTGPGSENFIYGTLAEWKAGTVDPSIDANTVVTAFEIEVDNWITQSEAYVDDITIKFVGEDDPLLVCGQIQDAVDTVEPAALIYVLPGTYDEQVEISDSLTLIGSGDATVIQPSGPALIPTTSIPWIGGGTGTMSAIVSVEATGDEVTIRDLEIDGSLITSKSTLWVGGLVYLETSGKIEGVTVNGGSTLPDRTAGIFAAAITTPASLEVTGCTVEVYTRAGIYAVGGTLTADYHHNEINGPGDSAAGVPNGIYFLVDAKGSATYNTITDLGYTGETYLSTGIGVYEAGEDVVFSHNEIFNVQMAFCLAKDSSGTTVEYNDIHDCHTGVKIEFGAANHTIQNNSIHDNDFAIRCDDEIGDGNVARFNNFINNLGAEWTNVGEGLTYVGSVCNLHETYGLEAGMNWWGDISGPTVEGTGQYYSGADSDSISGDVNFEPWLTRDFQTVLDDNIAYFGEPMVSLGTGWNTLSTPVALDSGCDTWGEYVVLGDGLNIHGTSPAYAYDPTVPGGWVPLIGEDDDYRLKPCDAIYVRMAEPDVGAILYSPEPKASTKDVYQGWNLVGLASLDPMFANNALTSLYMVTSDLTGYSVVISPPLSQSPWTFVRGGSPQIMQPTRGYWVFMENGPDTLAGFTFTPFSLEVPSGEGGLYEVPFEWYSMTTGSAGDDEYFTYTLPWAFPFAGKEIVRIGISSNGFIELLESGELLSEHPTLDYYAMQDYESLLNFVDTYDYGDFIFAWHDDLSSSYYGFYGVEYNGEVVVVHWETETYNDGDEDRLNYFQLWLFPDGSIQWNFKEFNYSFYGYGLGTGIYESDSGILLDVADAMGDPDGIFNTPEKSYRYFGQYWP